MGSMEAASLLMVFTAAPDPNPGVLASQSTEVIS